MRLRFIPVKPLENFSARTLQKQEKDNLSFPTDNMFYCVYVFIVAQFSVAHNSQINIFPHQVAFFGLFAERTNTQGCLRSEALFFPKQRLSRKKGTFAFFRAQAKMPSVNFRVSC